MSSATAVIPDRTVRTRPSRSRRRDRTAAGRSACRDQKHRSCWGAKASQSRELPPTRGRSGPIRARPVGSRLHVRSHCLVGDRPLPTSARGHGRPSSAMSIRASALAHEQQVLVLEVVDLHRTPAPRTRRLGQLAAVSRPPVAARHLPCLPGLPPPSRGLGRHTFSAPAPRRPRRPGPCSRIATLLAQVPQDLRRHHRALRQGLGRSA